MGNDRKRTSVIVVILWFFFFFPLGIYYLHRRLTEDKTESLKNSRSVRVCGWILISFGIIYLLIAFTEDIQTSEDLSSDLGALTLAIALFLGTGLRVLIGARNMKIRGMRYNRYCHIINGNVTGIANIAKAAAVSDKVALSDLQEMIDNGFYPGAYIDLDLQEIILPGNQNKQTIFDQPVAEKNVDENEKRKKVINCPYCGANCVVTEGTATECEYCGSPLVYQES